VKLPSFDATVIGDCPALAGSEAALAQGVRRHSEQTFI
jgi:hypothetical protein